MSINEMTASSSKITKLKSNIPKNYLFTLLYNLDLTRGIWMIYLASKGMSLTQLGLLETIFHLTSFTMEVPTGAVADIFGRKVSRVTGRILSLLSVVVLLISNSFIGFAFSFILTALSYNLESGAGDALIYDSLRALNDEDSYMKINGRKEVFYQSASVISFFFGGYLALRSYPLAFAITIGIGIVTILQSLTFTEPDLEIEKPEHAIFKTQLVNSIKVVKANPRISFLIVVGQMVGTFCTCIFFYNQNYLKALTYDESQIGIILAISSVAAGLMSTQVYRIERIIKEQGILFWLPWVTVACIWGIAFTKIHYIFFIVMMMTESVSYVALTDYINRLIPSENRATILSFSSMVFSSFMIILFPIVGVIGDKVNLKLSFMVMGSIGFILVLINSLVLKAKNAE